MSEKDVSSGYFGLGLFEPTCLNLISVDCVHAVISATIVTLTYYSTMT